MTPRIGRILVRSNESAIRVRVQVAECLAHLRVVDGHIKTDYNSANGEIREDFGRRLKRVVCGVLTRFGLAFASALD